MESKEIKNLRIGNIINNEHNRPCVVDFDTLSSIHYRRNMFYSFIELTEDWVIDFGFNPVELDNGDYFYQNNLFRLNSNYAGFYYSKNLPVKYVHQLQNLYFALTGTELELIIKN